MPALTEDVRNRRFQVAHGPWYQQQDRPFWELKPGYNPEPRYESNVRYWHSAAQPPTLGSSFRCILL